MSDPAERARARRTLINHLDNTLAQLHAHAAALLDGQVKTTDDLDHDLEIVASIGREIRAVGTDADLGPFAGPVILDRPPGLG